MEKLLTPRELMEALSIKKDKYQRLVREEMPCIRIGTEPGAHRRFELEKVLAWLEERREEVGGD